MGSKTDSFLAKLDQLQERNFLGLATKFYIAIATYLMDNLLLDNQVILDAKYLNPNYHLKNIRDPILRLTDVVGKTLGNRMCDVFEVRKDFTLENLKDEVKNKVYMYKMESIYT